MRVLCRRKPAAAVGSRVAAVVDGLEGPFDVLGTLVWKKRVGLFRWQIGVEFTDVLPAAKKGLTMLARASLLNDTIAVKERSRRSA